MVGALMGFLRSNVRRPRVFLDALAFGCALGFGGAVDILGFGGGGGTITTGAGGVATVFALYLVDRVLFRSLPFFSSALETAAGRVGAPIVVLAAVLDVGSNSFFKCFLFFS